MLISCRIFPLHINNFRELKFIGLSLFVCVCVGGFKKRVFCKEGLFFLFFPFILFIFRFEYVLVKRNIHLFFFFIFVYSNMLDIVKC